MAAAVIRIDQPAHPTQVIGVAGRARRDLVKGQIVNLFNKDDTGVRSHRWSILSQPDLGNLDTLSNLTVATPSFTPNQFGTYRIRLIVNEGRKGEVFTILAVVQTFGEKRFPAVGEEAEANWLNPDTGLEEVRGWLPDIEGLALEYDSRSIGDEEVTPSATTGGGTAEGTIDIRMLAPMGRYLSVTAIGDTVFSDFRMYADAARTILVYQATAKDMFTAPFEDGTPFALFRQANNLEGGQLYYRVTNNGANASTYEIRLVAKS